jgi:hypothetical protein
MVFKVVEGSDPVLWIPPKLREYVLKLFHEPPSRGHGGIDRLLQSLSGEVFWENMERDAKKYVKTCDVCQKYKVYKHQTPVMSQTIPKNPFEEISIDVVGPVPNARSGNRYILVMQDRLSRWIHFSPMIDTSADTTARTFLTDWVCQYGIPRTILTDRGRNFTSSVFRDLARFLGTQNVFTCAYRPQGNGQNERSHRELHSFIAMYLTPSTRSTWDTMLKVAAWIHNSSVHSALKMSPFEVVTGCKPKSAFAWLPTYTDSGMQAEQFQKYYGVKKRQLLELREKAQHAIEKGQTSYLKRLNLTTKERNYQVGDLVLIRSHAASTYGERKWSPRYKGPYVVKEVLNPVVIKIRDEKTCFEDTVHISYVRPFEDRGKSPPPDIDDLDDADFIDNDDVVDKEQVTFEREVTTCPSIQPDSDRRLDSRTSSPINADVNEEQEAAATTPSRLSFRGIIDRFRRPVSQPRRVSTPNESNISLQPTFHSINRSPTVFEQTSSTQSQSRSPSDQRHSASPSVSIRDSPTQSTPVRSNVFRPRQSSSAPQRVSFARTPPEVEQPQRELRSTRAKIGEFAKFFRRN